MKPRFESLDLQTQYGMLEKRFSCDTVFEASKFKELPQALDSFLSPRKSGRLEPIPSKKRVNSMSLQTIPLHNLKSKLKN